MVARPVHAPLGGQPCSQAELKKIANLANQVRGTLWESGEHFDQIFTQLRKILGYVVIYALLRAFTG